MKTITDVCDCSQHQQYLDLYLPEAESFPVPVIVSDNDIANRYEQTMLLMSTLKHFGQSEQAELKVMQGGHCAYVRAADENGDSVLGKLVLEFIEK